jgi:hypothetical protein
LKTLKEIKRGKGIRPFPLDNSSGIDKPLSGFFVVLAFLLGFDFDLVLPVGRLFEIADALAQCAADFGKLPCTEYDQNDDQYDYQFGHAKSKHVTLLKTVGKYFCQYRTGGQKNQCIAEVSRWACPVVQTHGAVFIPCL